MDNMLSKMKQENELLWRELTSMRKKHKAQEHVIQKVIHYSVFFSFLKIYVYSFYFGSSPVDHYLVKKKKKKKSDVGKAYIGFASSKFGLIL